MLNNVRKYKRYSVFGTGTMTTRYEENPRSINVQINNISQRGMGFYTDFALDETTPVSIELSFIELGEQTQKDMLEGSIASVLQQDEMYFMGVAFDHELSHDQLMKILQWE